MDIDKKWKDIYALIAVMTVAANMKDASLLRNECFAAARIGKEILDAQKTDEEK